MKYLNKIYALAFCAVAAMSFTACDDDTEFSKTITGDPENRVFTNVLYAAGHPGPANLQNSVGFTIVQSPVSSTLDGANELSFELPIGCIKPAEKDINITVTFAPGVPEGFKAFPATVNFSTKSTVIKAGQTKGESIIVSVDASEYAKFVESDVPYCQPITLLTSDEKVSEALGVAYLVVNAKFNNVKPSSTSAEGTQISSRTGWNITWNGNKITQLNDGRTNTYIQIMQWPSDVIVDMGQTESFKGVRFTWYSQNYSGKEVTISTSDDGNNWTEQGSGTMNRASSGYMNLYAGVECRYVKFTVKSYNSNANVVPTEIYLYTGK